MIDSDLLLAAAAGVVAWVLAPLVLEGTISRPLFAAAIGIAALVTAISISSDEPLREDCPRCGTELDHDEGLVARVSRCPSCRFEGAEAPSALLWRWVRRTVRR